MTEATNTELLEAMEIALALLSWHDGEQSSAGDAYKVLDAAIAKARQTA